MQLFDYQVVAFLDCGDAGTRTLVRTWQLSNLLHA